jgi:hypothetical protein
MTTPPDVHHGWIRAGDFRVKGHASSFVYLCMKCGDSADCLLDKPAATVAWFLEQHQRSCPGTPPTPERQDAVDLQRDFEERVGPPPGV